MLFDWHQPTSSSTSGLLQMELHLVHLQQIVLLVCAYFSQRSRPGQVKNKENTNNDLEHRTLSPAALKSFTSDQFFW